MKGESTEDTCKILAIEEKFKKLWKQKDNLDEY